AGADEPPRSGAIGGGVVGEHALDGDAALAVPGDRACEEGGARLAVLAGEDFGVGETGVVVDCDVEEVPAGAGAATLAVGEDPLADMPEAVEPFRVDVRQLARP